MNIIIDKDGNLYVNDFENNEERLAACIVNPADGDSIVYNGTKGIWEVGKAASGLPEVTADDNGDILTVVDGQWSKAAASGGGMVVEIQTSETGTVLDKTWKEIYDASKISPVLMRLDDEGAVCPTYIYTIGHGDSYFIGAFSCVESGGDLVFDNLVFTTDSENGYPALTL